MGFILLPGTQRRAHVIGIVLDSALQRARHVRAFAFQVSLPLLLLTGPPPLSKLLHHLSTPDDPWMANRIHRSRCPGSLWIVGLLPARECMAEVDHNVEEWLQWEKVVLSSLTCTVLILIAVTFKFNHYFWDFLSSSFPFSLFLCTSPAFTVSLFNSWDCS